MRAFSVLLALRYLRSRWINVVGALGVALAVWALIVVMAVFAGFIGGIRDDVDRSSPALLVTDLPPLQPFALLRPAIEADPDVLACAPRLRQVAEFFRRAGTQLVEHSQAIEFVHEESNFVQLLGIDPVRELQTTRLPECLQRAPICRVLDPEQPLAITDEQEWRGRQKVGLPVPPRLADFRAIWPGLLLSFRRVRYLSGLDAGDPIDVVSAAIGGPGAPPGHAVMPLHKVFAFAGVFDTGHRMYDETTALVPIESLRTMLGQDAGSDDSIDLVTDIAIAVRAGAGLQQVAERLRAAVQQRLPAGSKPCSVLTWEQQNEVFLVAVGIEQGLMKIVLLAVMLIATFLIYATLHMMVMQKVKDLGILSALGGTPGAVGNVFVTCSLVVGGGGCIAGVVLGVLTARYLNPILAVLHIELFPREVYDMPNGVPVRLDPLWIAQVTVGAFVLSLLAAWLPARKAARMDPVEALSYE